MKEKQKEKQVALKTSAISHEFTLPHNPFRSYVHDVFVVTIIILRTIATDRHRSLGTHRYRHVVDTNGWY